MTHGKYGIKYKNWSNKELKQFANLRGFEMPHTDRRDWIRMLREKDQETSIRFFDLPPEICNIVYRELLTPRSDGDDPESFVCHPAILTSRKQVYYEPADIMNTTTRIPVSLHIRSRYVGRDLTDPYAVEVCLNGRVLCYGQERNSAIEIPWPQYLARLGSITIQIGADPPWRLSHQSAATAGPKQLNNACINLYRTLWNSHNLRQVHIDISCALHKTPTTMASLSPISALAWRFENLTYTTDIRVQSVAQGIRDSIAAFKKIRTLTAEANLQVELNSSLLRNQDVLQEFGALP
jgi:hypothetical protein